jgi:hypothetical protein
VGNQKPFRIKSGSPSMSRSPASMPSCGGCSTRRWASHTPCIRTSNRTSMRVRLSSVRWTINAEGPECALLTSLSHGDSARSAPRFQLGLPPVQLGMRHPFPCPHSLAQMPRRQALYPLDRTLGVTRQARPGQGGGEHRGAKECGQGNGPGTLDRAGGGAAPPLRLPVRPRRPASLSTQVLQPSETRPGDPRSPRGDCTTASRCHSIAEQSPNRCACSIYI